MARGGGQVHEVGSDCHTVWSSYPRSVLATKNVQETGDEQPPGDVLVKPFDPPSHRRRIAALRPGLLRIAGRQNCGVAFGQATAARTHLSAVE